MTGVCLDLLHGFLGRGADWAPVVEALRARGLSFHARCPDLLGDAALPRAGFAGWAEAFCEEVRNEGEENRLLVGYSMGGRLALHALARAPELWRGAVLISTNPGILAEPYAQTRRARRAWEADWARRFLTEDWETLMAGWNALPVFGGSAIVRRESEHERAALAAAMRGWSLTRHRIGPQDLDALQDKALAWVFGREDRKFCAIAELLKERRTPGRFVFLPGTHRLLTELPGALATEIAALIEDLPRRGSAQPF